MTKEALHSPFGRRFAAGTLALVLAPSLGGCGIFGGSDRAPDFDSNPGKNEAAPACAPYVEPIGMLVLSEEQTDAYRNRGVAPTDLTMLMNPRKPQPDTLRIIMDEAQEPTERQQGHINVATQEVVKRLQPAAVEPLGIFSEALVREMGYPDFDVVKGTMVLETGMLVPCPGQANDGVG